MKFFIESSNRKSRLCIESSLIANKASPPPPLQTPNFAASGKTNILGRGRGGDSQMVLLTRTALVAGALTAVVPTAGQFPLSLGGWRWPPKKSRLCGLDIL
jgi:hypothetical protein